MKSCSSTVAEPRGDVFDRFMSLPGVRVLYPFYKKHKEFILYGLFGVLTVAVNVLSFALLHTVFLMNELAANAIAWVLSVLVAFATNRKWVFTSSGESRLWRQVLTFFGGRAATLALEEIILAVFVTALGFNGMVVKLAAQVIVIALNYVISKLFVFKGEKN